MPNQAIYQQTDKCLDIQTFTIQLQFFTKRLKPGIANPRPAKKFHLIQVIMTVFMQGHTIITMFPVVESSRELTFVVREYLTNPTEKFSR